MFYICKAWTEERKHNTGKYDEVIQAYMDFYLNLN